MDGLLYGVSMSWNGAGRVVTINPSTGSVRTVAGLQLPRGESAGSVVIGADRALYVTSNREDNRSAVYRVARDGSAAVTQVSSGPKLATSDTAGCLSGIAVPPTIPEPPPLPPGQTPRVDLPEAPVVNPPEPQSIAPPPPAPVVAPVVEPSPSPAAPEPPHAPTSKKRPNEAFVAAAERDHHTELKRRWVLTVLVLILGASAAAHNLRRR